ncbi:MAG: tetratricopeptide repeat protein [Bacteroidales bacterium]|nr:tetratricopeptide repeat protein [Bacteroidales bacterium]
MQIIHKIDEFLFTIFPEMESANTADIKSALEAYYTFGPFRPEVKIENDLAVVTIDVSAIQSQDKDYQKVVSLSEKGKFAEAKTVLQELISKNPTNSEFHRILGQILSEEGDQEEAINSLIDALRWNPQNGWALMMMGNIYTKHKNDVDNALKFYEQALKVHPDDYNTITNIGVNLLQQGNTDKAKYYFEKALSINGQNPNTHYGLALLEEMDDNLLTAFHHVQNAIKLNPNRDGLYQNAIRKIQDIAQKAVQQINGKEIYLGYKHQLEEQGGTEVLIKADNQLETAAKIEFAENYQRKEHVLKYNPNSLAVEHLIMHELVHLDFTIQARQQGDNQLFISNDKHKDLFKKDVAPALKRLRKKGVPEDSIENYLKSIFEGFNRQIYNAPVDLFIEHFLYNTYEKLRPFQFLSLDRVIREGIHAVTDKTVMENAPRNVISKSRIYNLVAGMQYKELFGVDFLREYRATPFEKKTAEGFYEEFKEYRDDKAPAEEYEVLQNWAEDLQVAKYFELEGEQQYRKRTNMDEFVESFEQDPLGLDDHDPVKDREMKKFQQSQGAEDTNMAVVMYMVDALQYFSEMPEEKIKKIAFDIAMQGTQGFDPNGKDYTVSSMPGKTFSGYKILAYYYISWALAIPEMVSELQLPYDKEYELALKMYKQE